MRYDHTRWAILRDRLSRLLDNEVRIFPGNVLDEFEALLQSSRPDTAAKVVEIRLLNGPLQGELLRQVSQEFAEIMHRSVSVPVAPEIPEYEMSAWMTVPATRNSGVRI